jgi:hypothetical protein
VIVRKWTPFLPIRKNRIPQKMMESEIQELLSRLSDILTRQLRNLQDLEFLPQTMIETCHVEEQMTKPSPNSSRHFIVTPDGHLGISVDCLLPLYKFSLQDFFKIHNDIKAVDPSLISLDQWTLVDSTSRLPLLLNPDHHTLWNTRKLLLTQRVSHQENVLFWETEVKFIRFLLTRHPKKTLIWSHWWWVLGQMHPHDFPCTILESIHHVVQKSGHDYFANYPAWRFLLQVFASVTKSQSIDQDKLSLTIMEEWERTWKWVRKHPTDPSGHHYLCQVGSILPRENHLEHLKRLEKLHELYGPRQVIWIHFYSFLESARKRNADNDVISEYVLDKRRRDYFPKDRRWDVMSHLL